LHRCWQWCLLRTPALAGLSIISQSSPKPLLEITFPLLFSKLPSTAPPLDAESARDAYRRILSSLSSLCIQPILFEILVLQTTSKLDTLCSPSTPSPRSEEERECQAVYAYALLSCLLAVLRKKVDAGHADVARYIDELVPRLFSIFVVAALSPSGQNEVACDPRLLAISSKIVETVVQTLSVE
jgi:DNA repair/transcription protein MET18/MMS19